MHAVEKIRNNNEALKYELTQQDMESSPMCNYYQGKSVFLTGATGFLGQLLMEKLLRINVKNIYILVRHKKNSSPVQRLKEIFEQSLFHDLRTERPDFFEKIRIVVGDLSELGLGIKPSDLQLMQDNVEIVLHSAADVRFQETLYDLVLTNLRGTRELLNMSLTFKKLQVFNYISTAYSNCCQRSFIKEDFYAPPMDVNKIINVVERCSCNPADMALLENLTDRLIHPWPNTYTFSKSLSEELVRSYGNKFPVCIVRPSVVISTYRAPITSWCNNVFGFNGVLVGMGIGVLRNSNIRYVPNVICADFTINAVLATTYSTHLNSLPQSEKQRLPPDSQKLLTNVTPNENPKIYTIAGSNTTMPFETLARKCVRKFEINPSERGLWIVCLNNTLCPFLNWHNTIFIDFFASVVFHYFLIISKSDVRLLPFARKIAIFKYALKYFTDNMWHFDQRNMHQLAENLHPVDKRLFFCDSREFDFDVYMYSYLQGLKHFIAKDSMENPEATLRKYKQMKCAHYVVRLLYYAMQAAIIYVLARGFGFIDFAQSHYTATREFFTNPESIQFHYK